LFAAFSPGITVQIQAPAARPGLPSSVMPGIHFGPLTCFAVNLCFSGAIGSW
jgi:hypothetical protein